MKKLNKTFLLSLTVLIALLVALPVVSFPSFFLQKSNMDSFGQLYANSQYVKGEATQQRIDDATLYIYAGYAYVKGEDPTTINFEHPPLGKYILGLSNLLFGNSLLLNLVIYAAFLATFASLARLFTQKNLLILGSVLFLGTTRLIYVNVGQGMLDIFSTLLLMLILRLLFSSVGSFKKYVLTGVLIGAIAATKYAFPSIGLPILLTLVWAALSKELLISLVSLPIGALTYLSSYVVYFLNHSLVDFIRFEWFRLKWWVVDRNIPPFLILKTLFVGQFQDWRMLTTVRSSVWSMSWPILFVSHFIGLLYAKFDKRILIIMGYASIQLAVYAVGSASYDRYLIGLIPLWLLVVVAGLDNYSKKQTVYSALSKSVNKKK